MEFRILGALEVVKHGETVALPQQKARALLAYLILRANEVVPTDVLVDAVWGENPPKTVTASLQNYVSRLRKALGADALLLRPSGYVLRAQPDRIDLRCAERLVEQAQQAEGEERAEKLRQALALWRGPALADLAYEPFTQTELPRLEELRLTTLEDWIDAELALGQGAALVGELEGLVGEHPLRERPRAQLMLALYRAGRQAEALEAYQRARATLVEELGIEPSPALRRLEQAILRQDDSLAAPSISPPGLRRMRPVGTVTFLFTDVEGSTRLLAEQGEGYADLLAEHRETLHEALARHGGTEVDTKGDAFFAAFDRARDAVAAAERLQAELAGTPMRVRVGVHTGEPLATEEGYVGLDVNLGARICAVAYGGQALVSSATRELVAADAPLRDLGLHRLANFETPIRLFQLGYDDFPPLPTLRQSNVPTPPNALVGRETELATARVLLRDHRLLTLVGPGGSGKTRLAVALAARSLEAFEDGVWWVPLEAVTDADLVLPAIAQTLGAKDSVARHIGDRSLLLVLDCFEHVVAAAPQIAALLAATPRAKLLVTSRELLRIAGEQRYEVPPLPELEAEALFLERARERDARIESSDAIGEICRRLDNLPLAIELAAGRVAVVPPEKLLERLEQRLPLLTEGPRDAPERQRTLRATVEWSYELLNRPEQQLFRRLAVFAGGFTLEGAEKVCGADLDMLESLVDKSLVLRTEHGSFGMLDTIREFATEMFEASVEAPEVRTAHAEYFLDVAEEVKALLLTEPRWLDTLDRDHDNVRAALIFTIEKRDQVTALRLASALWNYWAPRGHFVEARQFLEAALQLGEERRARVDALGALSYAVALQGDFARASDLAHERLALCRHLLDAPGAIDCLLVMGTVALDSGRAEEASELYEQARTEAEALGDQALVARASNDLAHLASRVGNLARARVLYEETLQMWRALDRDYEIGATLQALAWNASEHGEAEEAQSLIRESLAISARYPFSSQTGWALELLATLLAHRGAVEAAAVLAGAAAKTLETLGETLGEFDANYRKRRVDDLIARLGASRYAALKDRGAAMNPTDAFEYALDELSPRQVGA